MQLTTYTDYSLRVLIYLGVQPENKKSNIKEISDLYNISNNHLSKVVFELGKFGLVETIRGRNGGIKLAKQPSDINIGSLVRHTESPLHLVECFDKENNKCKITSACRLKGVLHEALEAYMNVLDSYTLSDLLVNENELQRLLLK
ncbi:Rrf2 family transcriptional regulator [Salipaludibacillus daqingensis]|uniref:Rrf2 family transcriptional regulator n=1 Tax=Salipaludibacillus daqingensis TaxID=3041001 RepID=UPI002474B046|nr:Rrf2 family transcriptional regulator [Salipaludibacillus daqingensis]